MLKKPGNCFSGAKGPLWLFVSLRSSKCNNQHTWEGWRAHRKLSNCCGTYSINCSPCPKGRICVDSILLYHIRYINSKQTMCNFFEVVLFVVLHVAVNLWLIRSLAFKNWSVNHRNQWKKHKEANCNGQSLQARHAHCNFYYPGNNGKFHQSLQKWWIFEGQAKEKGRKEYRNRQGGQTSVLCEAFAKFWRTETSATAFLCIKNWTRWQWQEFFMLKPSNPEPAKIIGAALWRWRQRLLQNWSSVFQINFCLAFLNETFTYSQTQIL